MWKCAYSAISLTFTHLHDSSLNFTPLHPMSRPVSVEDLILQSVNSAKPKFISKKKRELRTTVTKPEKVKRLRDEELEPPMPQPTSTKKTPRLHNGKFSFEWSTEEDTSHSYRPLVTLEPAIRSDIESGPSRHWKDKRLVEMTPRDWRIFKDDFNISSKGNDISNPMRLWHEEQLPKSIVDILTTKLGYTEPTPVQRATVPNGLNHRDVVGIAETGSGKTLAFLLPLLTYILNIEPEYMKYEHTKEANGNKALGLILAPTRELALQITKEAEKFATPLGLSVVTIIGGHQYEETVHSLRNGVHIVVATPGRLVDSLERGIISLEKCYHLTMDEADKMIDMGFEKSLQSILEYLPTSEALQKSIDSRIFRITKRTTLMFTATITPSIEKITKNYLTDPAYLFVGGANEVVGNISQQFDYAAETPPQQELDDRRVAKMVKILKGHAQNHDLSVIIFANFKRTVEQLADELANKGFPNVAVIHGSKTQEAREKAVDSFRTRKANVLIATDVAARGLDVPHVSMVVNFHMSKKFEEYIHRIGRTGRAGQKGESYTFIDDSDNETFPELKKFLSRGGYKIPEWLYRATMINH